MYTDSWKPGWEKIEPMIDQAEEDFWYLFSQLSISL